MKVIGITGGIGAGKSRVLAYIKEHCKCRMILADDVGNEVKLPGEICYNQLVDLLGNDILDTEGFIIKDKMAEKIFSDKQLLEKVNAIIHPAVKKYILSQIQKEKESGLLDFFFVEAALLIEGGYVSHMDEMWYIYADEQVRRKRLLQDRHYSDEKITNIMKGQLTEAEFKKHCQVVIDNSGEFDRTKEQIDKILGDKLWKIKKNIPDN